MSEMNEDGPFGDVVVRVRSAHDATAILPTGRRRNSACPDANVR
jgi:hypothetical protein